MEKQQLNTTIVYVLAILGLLCCCIGGAGFIPAGIAFFIATSKLKEVQANPENFENVSAMKTAKTVAMIILIINLAYFAMTIYQISTIGWDELMEQSREMMEQYQTEQSAVE